MTVIACLSIEPTEAACAACVQLTPVVEPLPDRILMDWTGCGSVSELARQLSKELRTLHNDRGELLKPGVDYRLGVAPLRFIAEVLVVANGDRGVGVSAALHVKAGANVFCTQIVGGCWVNEQTLPEFISALPVPLLPDVDEKVKLTLQALAVHTLGDLRRIRADLLHNHVGAAAAALLARAHGDDPRTVTPTYPSECLQQQISGEALAHALLDGAGGRLFPLIDRAVAPLAAQLHEAGGAAAHVAIHSANARQMRTFAEPVADPAQIGRVVRTLTEQLLSNLIRNGEICNRMNDLTVEIIPTNNAIKQMVLWDAGRPRNARQTRLQVVLDSLRNRFGEAIGFTGPRAAVARYETMLHLYGAKG